MDDPRFAAKKGSKLWALAESGELGDELTRPDDVDEEGVEEEEEDVSEQDSQDESEEEESDGGDDDEEEEEEEDAEEDDDDDEDDEDDDDDDDDDDGDDDDDDGDNDDDDDNLNKGAKTEASGAAPSAGKKGKMKTRDIIKPMSEEKLSDFREKMRKTGVVYLSRVPPFMRPTKLRHLMAQFGEVLHVYLTPEDPTKQRKRRKKGGNPARKYTEGWVEFADKKVAKAVASSLNNTTIGGKKRDYYHDDIWNLKYLKGFKWHHLTERLDYERKTREQRIRAEMAQAKRQSKFYLGKVQQAHSLAAQREKKRRRAGADGAEEAAPKLRRRFHQREAVETGQGEPSVALSHVMAKRK